MRREAIYVRQSVDKKESLSIEGQIELCQKKSVDALVFQDKGYSGKNTQRPELQRLISEIEQNKISKVLVYKLDRISRNITDFYKLYEIMEKHNCEFESVSEAFDTSTSMGRGMMGILAIFAQIERENIQKRVKDNYYYRTKETGSWAGGPPPYGFRLGRNELNKPMLIPIKEEKEAVMAMYALYGGVDNCTLGEVARWLNDNGYETRKNSAFQSATVSKILQTPIYVQADKTLYAYFKTRGVKFLNDEEEWDGTRTCHIIGKRVNNINIRSYSDMKEQSVYLTNFPGFIRSIQYINVQKRLGENKQIARANKIGALEELSGKLKCKKCGMAIKSHSVSRSDGRPYLTCYGKTTLHICEATYKDINFFELQDLIGNEIQKQLDNLEEIYKKKEEEQKELQLEIEKKQEEIENTILMSTHSESAAKAVAPILDRLQKELDELELKKQIIVENVCHTEACLDSNVELKVMKDIGIVNYLDMGMEQRREIVTILIDKIYLTDDINTLEIVWKI